MPSMFCDRASRSPGRCAYGSHDISRIVESDARATSVTERYFIGPDALSRIQPIGNVMDSPVPGGGGSVISAAGLGTVTSRSTKFRWKKPGHAMAGRQMAP